MGLYQDNLSYLKSNMPQLFSILTKEKPIYNLQVQPLEDGSNCIVTHEKSQCFLHSIYDIGSEMQRMCGDLDQNTERAMVFGLGMGNILQYLWENYSKLRTVIIIEPSLQIIINVLSLIDFRELLSQNPHGKVIFIVNRGHDRVAEEVVEVIKSDLQAKLGMIFHISYRTLFMRYYEELTKTIVDKFQTYQVNLYTQQALLEVGVKNTIANMRGPGIPAELLLRQLSSLNIPAVLVAAGPSLNKNIHLLEQLKSKALVIAVGTAIQILDNKGIKPHFRVAIDPFESQMSIFSKLNHSVSLIYDDMLYKEVLPDYHGETYKIVLNSNFLAQYFYKKMGIPFTPIISGYSVAISALDFLCKAGCKKVILVGQDLCYTDKKLYAEGSWNKENKDLVEEQYMIKVKNIYGEDVYTKRSFLAMKDALEQTIRIHNSVKFINATEGGLHIEQAEDKLLSEVIQSLDNKYQIDEIIGCSNHDKEKYEEIFYDKIVDVFTQIETEIESILAIEENMQSELKDLQNTVGHEPNMSKLLGFIRSLELQEKQLNQISLYRDVIVPELSEILRPFNLSIRTSAGSANYDYELYSKHYNKRIEWINRYIGWLSEALEEYRSEMFVNIFTATITLE